MKKQNQKGALLVEVIAVLGLIALITPILFHQLQRRNEEIVDAQIASEMRAVKDALSAYIQANEGGLADHCNLQDDGSSSLVNSDGSYKDVEADVSCGDADGWGGYGSSAIVEGVYTAKLYGRTVPSGPSDFRPVIYAIAWKTGEPEPDLRRASKVAAMIGIEGGVFDGSNTIQGMQGVWSKTINENVAKNTVAVTTSFDATTNSAILKDATFSNMQTTGSIQSGGNIVATGGMFVGDIFSIGDENCIVDYMNDTVSINTRGQTQGTGDGAVTCAPVFEVNPTTKEVYLAGVIRTGVSSGGENCGTNTSKDTCEAVANCVWTKQATSDDENAHVCMAEYLLNPSETSMMNDIKLSSRGGAKLSEILPNWSLMKVEEQSGTSIGVEDYTCPDGYRKGIVVLPSSINKAGIETLTITNNTTGSVSVSNLETGDRIIVHKYCVHPDGEPD